MSTTRATVFLRHDRNTAAPPDRACRTPRGLTLIEVAVALAIIAVMFSAVAVGVGALLGTKARAAAGELGGIIRSLYDTAALRGTTCRLAFELPAERDEEGRVRYWAECAPGAITAAKDRDEELADAEKEKDEDGEPRFKRSTLEEALAAEQSRVQAQVKYSSHTDEYLEPKTLPAGVKVSVWTRHQTKLAEDGRAFLYFFPQGYTEKAMIFFRQGDNVWTLTVSPLTGKTKVVAEALEVPTS